MNARHHPALDGLRALAALVVLLAHAHCPGIHCGVPGVDVFFVLSGFLITGVLAAEFRRSGRVSLRNFYARRILRLAPALALGVALAVAVAYLLHRQQLLGGAFFALTYTANWALAFEYRLGTLGHCWSLAIEEQYYLVWPFAVIALERSRLSDRGRGLALFALAAALCAYRLAAPEFFPVRRVLVGTDTRADGLVLGSALAYLGPSLRGWWSGPLACLGLAGLVWVVSREGWAEPWLAGPGITVATLSAAALVLALTAERPGPLGRLFSAPPLAYLGKISYGLYLYHPPLYDAADTLLPSAPPALLLAVKLGAVLAAAALSYRLVESRFLRLKRRFAGKPPDRPVS